jgi:hypothetical protein
LQQPLAPLPSQPQQPYYYLQQQQQQLQQQQQPIQQYSAVHAVVQPRSDTPYSSASSNSISSSVPHADLVDDVTARTQALNMLVDASALLQSPVVQQQQHAQQPQEHVQQQQHSPQQQQHQQQLLHCEVLSASTTASTDLSFVITPHCGCASGSSVGAGSYSNAATSGPSQHDVVVTDVATEVAANSECSSSPCAEWRVSDTAQQQQQQQEQQSGDVVDSATELNADSSSTASAQLAHAQAAAGTAARAQALHKLIDASELLDRLLAEQLQGHSSTFKSVTAAKDLLKERMCYFDRQHDVKAVCAAGHLLHELVKLRGSCHRDKDARVLQVWADSQHKRAQSARAKLQKVTTYGVDLD